MLTGTRDRDLVLVTSLREKLKAAAAAAAAAATGAAAGAGYGASRKGARAEDVVKLFETISQVLLSAVDRDAKAGWGAVVHVITPEGVTTRELKARQD